MPSLVALILVRCSRTQRRYMPLAQIKKYPEEIKMRKIIDEVLIHPVHNRLFITGEHPDGELESIGDAIGRDTMIVKNVDGWLRMYKNDGKANEDWYGWG